MSRKYLSKEGQAQIDPSKGRTLETSKDKVVEYPKEAPVDLSTEQLAIYVAEELNKLKVSLSSYELLRVPTIRNVVLGAYNANLVSQDILVSESVNKASSSQPIKGQNQIHNQVYTPPGDKGKEKDKNQVA